MARVTVWIFIECTDLTVEEMSARIGLAPDKSWRIGDPRGATGKRLETNSWTLELVSECAEDPGVVGEQIHKSLAEVLARVEACAQRFRSVAVGKTAGVYLGIFADENPPIPLSAATLSAIAALGVDLEIDLMTGK